MVLGVVVVLISRQPLGAAEAPAVRLYGVHQGSFGMKEWYSEKHCDSWGRFLQYVSNFKLYLFRGQSDAEQQLLSTFDRAIAAAKEPKESHWMYEAVILREFRRRAHHYVQDTPPYSDRLEWLALMRHYGAPTRLVDFTYSPYIAAYFAFSSLCKSSRAVWAVNNTWLRQESHRRYRKLTRRKSAKPDFYDPKTFTQFFLKPEWKKEETDSVVCAVSPNRMNARLTIQQGLFLCPTQIQLTFDKVLRNMVAKSRAKEPIVKFVFPPAVRNEFITELRRMNISKATLFPDLSGLAESLSDRFEIALRDYKVPQEILRKVVTWQKEDE
jgi:hypothetical protein